MAAESGTCTVHEPIPHSKPPYRRPAVGVGGVEHAVAVGVAEQVGPQLQAEMYRSGVVPQAAVALVG